MSLPHLHQTIVNGDKEAFKSALANNADAINAKNYFSMLMSIKKA